MYHYEYVTQREAAPYREKFLEILREVQDLVRDKFTFSYYFIGSSSRNMITCDRSTNKGFDFDINLCVNDDDEEFDAEEIKKTLMRAIDQTAVPRGFRYCEDSTRVITLKKNGAPWNRIEYSCDFAIVNDYTHNGEHCQQYIHFNKKQGTYTWQDQPHPCYLNQKVNWIKGQGLWGEVRDIYLDKKNNNTNPDKRSRALYAESVNEVCVSNGYYQHR